MAIASICGLLATWVVDDDDDDDGDDVDDDDEEEEEEEKNDDDDDDDDHGVDVDLDVDVSVLLMPANNLLDFVWNGRSPRRPSWQQPSKRPWHCAVPRCAVKQGRFMVTTMISLSEVSIDGCITCLWFMT